MKIAEPTIDRLVQYHRLLAMLQEDGRSVVSSRQLGEILGFKASQIRKDLSYFGEIGKRGVGYSVSKLREHIASILSSPGIWRLALVGAGHIGSALLANPSFRRPKISFEAIFEADASKIGKDIYGIRCYDFRDMPAVMSAKNIEVLVLAVPAKEAQKCIDLAVSSGKLRGVLALTKTSIAIPEPVRVVRVDVLAELEKLLFFIKHAPEGGMFDID